MWRNRKLMIIAVVVVVVILAGTVGGIALAQTPTPTPGTAKTTIMARVATILGIDQKKIEDAFAQAEKDLKQEAIDNFLKGKVASGNITQQQADQFNQWRKSQPVIPGLQAPNGGARGPRGMMPKGRMMPGWGGFRGGPGAVPGPSATPK